MNTTDHTLDLTGWIARIRNCEMPVFGRTVDALHTLMEDEKASASALAQVILKDAAMTTKVLRLANSAFFNHAHQGISTVSRAIVVLGFDPVAELALSVSLVDSLLSGGVRSRVHEEMARSFHAAVQARWRVDAGRVFATGMSNGGMLAHRLACDAADVFRAVASVAGTDATERCSPSRPISVLHIHARDDTHVLFDGGAGPGAFRDTSKVMNFVSVPETISRWVARDRCTGPAQRTWEVPGAYCETTTGCADGREVQLCVTETGGHSWPGAGTVRRGKAPASKALDANDAIWRFFERASP